MGKGPKPNANPAQLRAAKAEGMDITMVFCLTVLADKYGFDREALKGFLTHIKDLSEGITRGYIQYKDLHRVLVDEQDLDWRS